MEDPKKINAAIESDDEDLALGREWFKIDRGVKNDGFRIGMEESQEEALQRGFNAAFKESLHMALAGGKLQGGICANLTCASSDVLKSRLASPLQFFNQSDSEAQNTDVGSRGAISSSPLQNLLSSNTELVSSIPNLLTNDFLKSFSQNLLKPSDNHSINLATRSDSLQEPLMPHNEMSECTRLTGSSGQGDQTAEQKGVVSCEHVCNDKSHFWNQLESFKMQAQSLGVISADD